MPRKAGFRKRQGFDLVYLLAVGTGDGQTQQITTHRAHTGTCLVLVVTPYFFDNGATLTGVASIKTHGSGTTAMVVPATPATIAALANLNPEVSADFGIGASRGIPVLNMLANGNVNVLNLSKQTRDPTHPTDLYMSTEIVV